MGNIPASSGAETSIVGSIFAHLGWAGAMWWLSAGDTKGSEQGPSQASKPASAFPTA